MFLCTIVSSYSTLRCNMNDPIKPIQSISRSLLLVAPRALTWQVEPLPPIGSDQVLLRTIAGAISVGSELPVFRSL